MGRISLQRLVDHLAQGKRRSLEGLERELPGVDPLLAVGLLNGVGQRPLRAPWKEVQPQRVDVAAMAIGRGGPAF